MTRDDIIRMAKESGLDSILDDWLHEFTPGNWPETDIQELERFAALVAAAEREACAKVAESYEPTCDTCPSGVANAIRARGEA